MVRSALVDAYIRSEIGSFGIEFINEHWDYYLGPDLNFGRNAFQDIHEGVSHETEWLFMKFFNYDCSFSKHNLSILENH